MLMITKIIVTIMLTGWSLFFFLTFFVALVASLYYPGGLDVILVHFVFWVVPVSIIYIMWRKPTRSARA